VNDEHDDDDDDDDDDDRDSPMGVEGFIQSEDDAMRVVIARAHGARGVRAVAQHATKRRNLQGGARHFARGGELARAGV